MSFNSAHSLGPRAACARRSARDPDALIRLLYGAALQPELWPEALDAIGDALGGAVLVASHRRIGGPVLGVTHRLDPAADAVLRARYSQVETNPLMGAMRRLPVLSPVWRDAVMVERDYLSSGLFQEVFRPQGLQHAAISCLAREGRLLIASGVLRRNAAEFDAHHLRLYQRLLPHLRQSLEIAARFSDLSLRRDLACLAADATESAVFLVDRTGSILFCNGAAEQILAQGDGLRQRHNVLGAAHPEEAQILLRLVRAAALRLDMHGGGLRVSRAEADGFWGVVVLPAPSSLVSLALGPSCGGCALILAVDLAARPVPPEQRLAQMLALTEAEARLAAALLRGHRPEDIAAERGVSIATVRTQLRSIFSKTGTRTQSDLMRTLARVPVIGPRAR